MATAAKAAKEPREDLRERLAAAGEDLTPPRERAANEGQGPRTPEQIFGEMDPQEWACRSQEHSWPQLPPNAGMIPPGMRFSAAGRGNTLQTDDCLHGCGRFRETLLDRQFGVISRTYRTRPGARHVVVHQDETMSKGQMRQLGNISNKALIKDARKIS